MQIDSVWRRFQLTSFLTVEDVNFAPMKKIHFVFLMGLCISLIFGFTFDQLQHFILVPWVINELKVLTHVHFIAA